MSISWDIKTFATVDSTQNSVKDAALDGADEGLVVQALTQSAGRGRHGNEWESPLGNLYMSVLLRPLCSADLAAQISFVVALAVAAAIEEIAEDKENAKVSLKWPNDVLVGGKKAAGILLESELSPKGNVAWLVTGIGVNVLAAPEGRACVKDVSGANRLAVHPFRDRILHFLDQYYHAWKAEGFAPVRHEWLKKAHGLGHKMTARLASGKEEKGIFRGIDQEGALTLETGQNKENHKEIVIRAADIYFEGHV